MSPVTGPQRNKGANDETTRQNDYQEIHAAILELYRLMGAPRSMPTTPSPQYFPGYSVYTYPAAQPAAYSAPAATATPFVGTWPTPVVTPYQQAASGYVQGQGNGAWATAY